MEEAKSMSLGARLSVGLHSFWYDCRRHFPAEASLGSGIFFKGLGGGTPTQGVPPPGGEGPTFRGVNLNILGKKAKNGRGLLPWHGISSGGSKGPTHLPDLHPHRGFNLLKKNPGWGSTGPRSRAARSGTRTGRRRTRGSAVWYPRQSAGWPARRPDHGLTEQ